MTKTTIARAGGKSGSRLGAVCMGLAALASGTPVRADIAVSQLIVELKPGTRAADIELSNDADEQSFVSIEPREIIAPGTPAERPFSSPDPQKLGVLVSPNRLILQPGQRRTVRIASLDPPVDRERVFRVTVRPVAGEVSGSESGLKLLVGYDLLLLVRPISARQDVQGLITGQTLTITNRGNASVELAGGRQCDDNDENCLHLPAKRLYAGASWKQTLPRQGRVLYRIRSADGWSNLKL